MVGYYQDLGRTDEVWEIVERLRPFHQDSANFHVMDGGAKSAAGHLADGYRAYRRAYELAPDTPFVSSQFAFSLIGLQDTEQAMDVVPPQFSFVKNFLTGEWDEVLPQLRAMLDADPMIPFAAFPYALGSTFVGDYEGLVDFYDQHVQSPQFYSSAGTDFLLPLFVPAMQALGRDDDVTELLAAIRANLEKNDAQGVASADQSSDWAEYYALSGEYDDAFTYLRRAFEQGERVSQWRYSVEWNAVAQDPRLIALKKDNLDAINAERVDLGWDPVAEVGILVSAAPAE